MNNLPVNKVAWIRLALLGLALINQSLVMLGYSPLPIDDADFEQFLSLLFVVATALISGWKDNDITKKARLKTKLADEELKKKGLK